MKVWVIGASRGIGLGLVERYLGRGDEVLALVRTPNAALDGLAATAAGRLQVVTGDLCDPDLGARLLSESRDEPLDRLIVNAGIMGPHEAEGQRATVAELGELFLTNAVAPLRLLEALAPRLAAAGVAACLSSQMGSVSLARAADMPLYGASKAALNSLLQSWVAGRQPAFAVLALHPGWVRTALGGAGAPVEVADSVAGLVATIEVRAGQRGCAFLDYQGQVLPW
ncbi:SDR family NAD(P)-dependent oxidoreductase [Pseudomonas sp. AS2.8]|uniref:SDR family NAD(P)-dependent oxidoreductase n=1 Tax=Pseudomonas sp. AS2.8 TaxID=2587128 RepID=UPI00160FAE88|nr:SDR family NAD(P)-dependent oxidoreductase [Pseudomonas sp. AS2.8]MBB2896340.1 NAD(P)-dependent dehydrogenase (short-subunit alcohol dehydrogenase family) [Pseudomonas sp. AS2.8]